MDTEGVLATLTLKHQRQTQDWTAHKQAVGNRNAARATRQQTPAPLPIIAPAPAPAPRRTNRVGDCRHTCRQGNPCCCSAAHDHQWHICSNPGCTCHKF